MRKWLLIFLVVGMVPLMASRSYDPLSLEMMKVLVIDAYTVEDRTDIASLGIAIEEIYEDYVIGLAFDEQVAGLMEAGFRFELQTLPAFLEDFPPADSDFHNLDELEDGLFSVAEDFPDIASLYVVGRSVEDRPLYMMRISGPNNFEGEQPGIIFLGTHHAREHLSTEVALNLIYYLVDTYGEDEEVTSLIDNREIWVMPMVNPDGADYDVQAPSPYKWWRKNRKASASGHVFGVDLNRNYGYQWGGRGSSGNQRSQTYRGDAPFSEPETQAIRDFLEENENITTLLSYHTFSELVLYPWGHTMDSIEDEIDLQIHEALAYDMGQITGYTPQQSSDLYVTSGDTTDWAYGELGIFSFTIELYPTSMMSGGFYPSAEHIQE